MTQEDKNLLLQDLCARLSYRVICQFTWTYCNETTDREVVIAIENDNIRNIDINIKEVRADYYDKWVDLENCKPYLRPMSSMTKEEIDEYNSFFTYDGIDEYCFLDYIDWLNTHYFDYRGLIEKGLALEAPEGMYKTE